MAITLDGTTGISSVDASASSPSVRGADSNSGIFYSADAIKFSTGGTQRAIIDNNGLSSAGHIVQYVTAISLGMSSTTSSTTSEITSDLRVTMTPISASNKLIITANLVLHSSSDVITVRMYRQDTGGSLQMVNEPSGFASGTWNHGNANAYANSDPIIQTTVQVIETAGNTTERFYSPYYAIGSGTATNNSYNAGSSYKSTSTMTVMEVAA